MDVEGSGLGGGGRPGHDFKADPLIKPLPPLGLGTASLCSGPAPSCLGETQSHRYQLKNPERKSIFVCKTRQKAKIGMS